jgi:hypothetical protein
LVFFVFNGICFISTSEKSYRNIKFHASFSVCISHLPLSDSTFSYVVISFPKNATFCEIA